VHVADLLLIFADASVTHGTEITVMDPSLRCATRWRTLAQIYGKSRVLRDGRVADVADDLTASTMHHISRFTIIRKERRVHHRHRWLVATLRRLVQADVTTRRAVVCSMTLRQLHQLYVRAAMCRRRGVRLMRMISVAKWCRQYRNCDPDPRFVVKVPFHKHCRKRALRQAAHAVLIGIPGLSQDDALFMVSRLRIIITTPPNVGDLLSNADSIMMLYDADEIRT
jgi:hypothetical protein